MDTIEEAACNCIIEDLFTKRFNSRSYSEMEHIVKMERPQPKLNITSKAKKFVRYCREEFYEYIPWLCGCVKLQKYFCWPCLLFSTEINVWNKNGFNDLNNLSKARKRHESSKYHIDAFVKFKQFGNECRCENHFNKQHKMNIDNHNKTVAANRYIISKLIDVICFVSDQEIPFKGDVSSGSHNRGDYTEHVYLLSSADSQLKMHLEQSSVFTESLNSIQYELIHSIGNVLLEEIKKEINAAPFVAIIVDETDISHIGQMSTIFRFVSETGDIQERFVGCSNISTDRDSNSLFTSIKKYLDEFKINNKQLVAQTYDGAAVMATQHNAVQTNIKEIYEHAKFIHCYSHRLSSVFFQCVSFIKECQIFRQIITGFSSFFSKSTKRSNVLDEAIKRRFRSAAPAQWNYESKTINSIIKYKSELKDVLLSMTETPEQWDAETTITARGLHHYLTDFDFLFLLQIFSKIFPQSDILFATLQENIFDIGHCTTKLYDLINFLQKLRNDFNSIWNAIEREENSEEVHANKRLRLDDTKCSKSEVI